MRQTILPVHLRWLFRCNYGMTDQIHVQLQKSICKQANVTNEMEQWQSRLGTLFWPTNTRRGWKNQNNKRLCKQIQWLPDKTRRPASNNSLSMSWWVHQAMINWGKQHTTSTQKTRCHMRSIRCFQDRGKHFPLAALTWDDNTCEDPRCWQSFYMFLSS